MQKDRQFWVEAQGFPCFKETPLYAVLFGPFNPNYKREVLSDLKKTCPEGVKLTGYTSE